MKLAAGFFLAQSHSSRVTVACQEFVPARLTWQRSPGGVFRTPSRRKLLE